MEAYFLLKRLTSLWKNIELEPGTAMETYIYIYYIQYTNAFPPGKYFQPLILSIWGFARWIFPFEVRYSMLSLCERKGIKTMHWKTACQSKKNGGVFIWSLRRVYPGGVDNTSNDVWIVVKQMLPFNEQTQTLACHFFFERLPAKSLKAMEKMQTSPNTGELVKTRPFVYG